MSSEYSDSEDDSPPSPAELAYREWEEGSVLEEFRGPLPYAVRIKMSAECITDSIVDKVLRS